MKFLIESSLLRMAERMELIKTLEAAGHVRLKSAADLRDQQLSLETSAQLRLAAEADLKDMRQIDLLIVLGTPEPQAYVMLGAATLQGVFVALIDPGLATEGACFAPGVRIFPTVHEFQESSLGLGWGKGPARPNLRLCNARTAPEGPLHVYELDSYWASNFSAFSVDILGWTYMTAEHAYQASKFMFNTPSWNRVARATSAHAAKQEASFALAERKEDMAPNFQEEKRVIMKAILRCKLEQHPYIQISLFETGNREIVEVSPVDEYWGWGKLGDGRNELGKIWMELREEMHADKT